MRTEDIPTKANSDNIPMPLRLGLAKRLYTLMERLDPTPEALAWDDLPPEEQDFYRHCIEGIVDEVDYLRKMYGVGNDGATPSGRLPTTTQ
jgi:hypothetical protein